MTDIKRLNQYSKKELIRMIQEMQKHAEISLETVADIENNADIYTTESMAWQMVGALENALKHIVSDEDCDEMVTFRRLIEE